MLAPPDGSADSPYCTWMEFWSNHHQLAASLGSGPRLTESFHMEATFLLTKQTEKSSGTWVQDRLTCQLTYDMALIIHPAPESGCLYWHSHGVMKAMLTGLTQRACTVAIHELTLTWLHNHRFLLLSSQDKHFTISLSAYVLLFFLSFSAWSPLPPLPSQLSFVLLLWDMAFFSFQSLFRLNNTIFYFSGKYYIFFLETIPSLLSVCSAKDWELIQTEPSRSCYIECEMAPNIPELWKPKWAWYLP